MRVVILGGSGAVGRPITQSLCENGSQVQVLNSSNFDLNSDKLKLAELKSTNVFIHSSGTFGGLKQYTENGIPSQSIYLNNLKRICAKLNNIGCSRIINISSAALSNVKNFKPNSSYFEYVSLKKEIEDIFDRSNIKDVVHIRPTNIISSCERTDRSKHVIASLFNKINSDKSLEYDIWSSSTDWREFTDASDLANFIHCIIQTPNKERRKIYYCSNNQKIYIDHIVRTMSMILHGKFPKNINYTQSSKPGPIPKLLREHVGTSVHHILNKEFNVSLEEFINAQI